MTADTRDTRPLLGLDVDGVLACFGGETEERDPNAWEVPPDSILGHSAIYIPQGTSGRIRALIERFDVVWATQGWQYDAHDSFAGHVKGIGAECCCDTVEGAAACVCNGTGRRSWPTIDFSRCNFDGRSTWKLSAVQRYIGNRPFAWLDDDLLADAFDWANDRATRLGIPTKLVRPHATIGLTDEHVAELLLFADAVEETTRTQDDDGRCEA